MTDGSLDVGCPLLPITAVGTVGVAYSATEIFGEEIATLVTSDSVYRETLYNVVIPYDVGLKDRILAHLSVSNSSNLDPWVFFRERLIVSIVKGKVLYA